MRKSNHLLIVTGLMVLLVFILTGCVTEYENEDIETYVRDELKISNAVVEKEPEKRTDPQNYEDLYWKVKIQDETGLEFYVIDDRGWGSESETNTLRDNYDETMLEYFYGKYNGLKLFTFSEDKEEFMPELKFNRLSAQYETLEDLEKCFEELQKFKSYVEEQGYLREDGLDYEILMDNPIRYAISDDIHRQVNDGDIKGKVTGLDEMTRKHARTKYLLTCLDYGFENLLNQFSHKEIEDAVSHIYQQVGISRTGDEEGSFEYYDDICADVSGGSGSGLSFGTLYCLLQKEGISVEGDVNHYTFTGEAGNRYEISYDFHEVNPEDQKAEGQDAYYYLKNGERIWMPVNFYNHFDKRQVKEMTGLVIVTTRDDFKKE